MNFRVYYNAIHWGVPDMPYYRKPLRCRLFGHRYEHGDISVRDGKVAVIHVECERCGALSCTVPA